jgi:hypothetical protein
MLKLFISIFIKLLTCWASLCVLCFLAIFFFIQHFYEQVRYFNNSATSTILVFFVLFPLLFYCFISLDYIGLFFMFFFFIDVLQLSLFFIFVMNFHNHDIASKVVSFYQWQCWTFQHQLCVSLFFGNLSSFFGIFLDELDISIAK